MRKCLIILFCLEAAPSFAQSAAPASPDEQIAQCVMQAGQVQAAYGQTKLQLIAAEKEIARLKAKYEPPKPSETKGP